MLKVGDRVPQFKLLNTNGAEVHIGDFSGKKIVIYFYPKDDTPGCTKQACSFRDNFTLLKNNNVEVIGISKDTQKSHKKFTQKYSLPFNLLCDTEKEVMQQFGVWEEKSMYGKLFLGTSRTTFIIDENGIVEKVFPKVKAMKNCGEVIEYLGLNGV